MHWYYTNNKQKQQLSIIFLIREEKKLMMMISTVYRGIEEMFPLFGNPIDWFSDVYLMTSDTAKTALKTAEKQQKEAVLACADAEKEFHNKRRCLKAEKEKQQYQANISFLTTPTTKVSSINLLLLSTGSLGCLLFWSLLRFGRLCFISCIFSNTTYSCLVASCLGLVHNYLWVVLGDISYRRELQHEKQYVVHHCLLQCRWLCCFWPSVSIVVQ